MRRRRSNRPLRRALQAADHVLYQSEFSKQSADLFLGDPRGTWEVLRNAIDVSHFTPPELAPTGGPVLLLGGDQTQAYRLELALRTLATLLGRHPDARLLVTGRLVCPIEPLLRELGLQDRVELIGAYAQRDAPGVFHRAHLLLHTKVMDPCPTLVLEAMASGLPVVYPASGGTVELVGDEGGIGVPHPTAWERDEPPAPEALATPSSMCSPTGRRMPRRPGRERSSASRSSRGSIVTRRCSRSWLRGSRAAVLAESRRGNVHACDRA